MARGEWVVEAAAAFAVWEVRSGPSPDAKGELSSWLANCEEQGPPPANELDERGNLTARGPRGERIRFRRFDFPGEDPPGYMFVLSID